MDELTLTGATVIPQCISETLNSINSILDAYKECKLISAREETQRTSIREKAKIYIYQLEKDTEKYKEELKGRKEVALRLINTLDNLLSQREILDDNTMQICQLLIEKAVETSYEKSSIN